MEDLIPPRTSYETKSGRIKKELLSSLFDLWRSDNKMRCCRCRYIKHKEHFYEFDFNRNRHPYCIQCKQVSHRGSERRIKTYKKLNITHSIYEQMLKQQKGKCLICSQEETQRNCHTNRIQALAVDHCHTTGNVRGLLCRNCNLMIGNAKDSEKILRAGAKYIKKSKLQQSQSKHVEKLAE